MGTGVQRPGGVPAAGGGPVLAWRRNLAALTAVSFIGFTGFTLVMPFLPLYMAELGLHDVGAIALWTGFTLGITPAITALLAPAWGRLADRFGRKLMVARSLGSFVVIMAAMAWVTQPWHLFALRAIQGLFAGYGPLCLAMAAESSPRGSGPAVDRHGADGAAARAGAWPGDRWRCGGSCRTSHGVSGDIGVLRDRPCPAAGALQGARYRAHVVGRRPGARHLQQRARVRELPAADGGHLRTAVRRSQLRARAAAPCRGDGRRTGSRRVRLGRRLLRARLFGGVRPPPLRPAAAALVRTGRHQRSGARVGRRGRSLRGDWGRLGARFSPQRSSASASERP